MADFNASASSAEKPTFSTSIVLFPGAVDDASEDACSCSICLEPFNCEDPATITSCKHDYHLHCILEWVKRSNECPICSQLLVMKDPASQELLVSMKNGRCSRSINPIATSTILSLHEEDYELNVAAAASRVRNLHRTERQRSSGQEFVSSPEEVLTFDSSDRQSQPSSSLTESHYRSPSSVAPTNTSTAFHPYAGSEPTMKPRVRHWQAPSDSTQRTNTCDIFSFPESIKSKFSTTSARYKGYFSRRTQGIKEKLLARNSSLKELSKGVQREMTAGIAGFARMIERLDLVARRNATPSTGLDCAASTGNIFKGMHVRENVIIEAPILESGNNVHGSSSNATSCNSCPKPGSAEGSRGMARKDINPGNFDPFIR